MPCGLALRSRRSVRSTQWLRDKWKRARLDTRLVGGRGYSERGCADTATRQQSETWAVPNGWDVIPHYPRVKCKRMNQTNLWVQRRFVVPFGKCTKSKYSNQTVKKSVVKIQRGWLKNVAAQHNELIFNDYILVPLLLTPLFQSS